MFSTPIQDFERMAELQFPLIINPANCNAEENYPDYSLAVYTLDRCFEMEEFLDMIEMYSDLILLFRHTPTKDTDAGKSVCFYSSPRERHMFKFFARTNASGVFESVTVTVYNSHESMRAYILDDARSAAKLPGKVVCRSMKDIDIDFMVLP